MSKAAEENYALDEATKYKAPTFLIKELKSKYNRWKLFQGDEETPSNGLLGLLTLAILILAPFSIFLLPLNNEVGQATKYWYELMYSTCSFFLFSVLSWVTSISIALDPFKKSLLKVMIDLLLIAKVSEIILLCIMHLLWSDVLGYFEPFPFRQYISSSASLALLSGRMWTLIPQQRRLDPIFRKQFMAYVCVSWWITFVTFQLIVLVEVIDRAPKRIQWAVALIVPFTKEINDRILDRLVTKAALSDNLVQAKFIGKISINVAYSFWIAVTMATMTTTATGYVLLAINYFIDLMLCYRVIKLDNMVITVDCMISRHQSMRNEVLTELILNEIIAVLAPVAFIGTFLIAYYGPNRNNLKVVCKLRQSKVVDINSFLMPVFEMTVLDSGSLIISGVLLWCFCRINIWEEYCRTIKKYWHHLAFWGGTFICAVSFI